MSQSKQSNMLQSKQSDIQKKSNLWKETKDITIVREHSLNTVQLSFTVIMIMTIMTIIAIPLGIYKRFITIARHKIFLPRIWYVIACPILAAILWILPSLSGLPSKIRNHEERQKRRLNSI